MPHPCVIVVMGVAGSGKTTLAKALARRLDCPFQEGDALHSKANITKMAQGRALTDRDRAPWLTRIRTWIDDQLKADRSGVITCSALKHRYRDRIGASRSTIALVYLKADASLLADRLLGRQDHFMPATLLKSQLEALEPPGSDEHPIKVQANTSLEAQVEAVLQVLSERRGTAAPSPLSAG